MYTGRHIQINKLQGVHGSIDGKQQPVRPLFPLYQGISLMNSDNKGDYHEAFNLGLDPSLGYAVEESGGEGELEHGDNLWPDKEVWSGAERFVSCYRQ
jgi:hypothetical protein